MRKVHLTLAMSDYDHVRDFTRGDVEAQGIDITYLDLSVEEIFHRFTAFREWEVSEMSVGKYASLVSQGDDSLTAIPVFPSRIFRQSSIYVRRGGGIEKPEDLAGKRVGIPEWAQTAAIYTRAYLMHQVGIALADIDWHQAGVNQPGRAEKVDLKLPPGVRCTAVPDRSLTEMLGSGDLDAVMTARPPGSFERGDSEIIRLFSDYRDVEEAYYRETGVFPIMHLVVISRAVLDAHPWVAMNLFKAFEEAKRRGIERVLDVAAPRVPIPWCFDHVAKAKELFGDDYWPYGIEPNRVTLEAFLGFAHEQGVCVRKVEVEELFAKEVQSVFKV